MLVCAYRLVAKEKFHGLTRVSLEIHTRELLVYVLCLARVSRVLVGFVSDQIMALAVLRTVLGPSESARTHVP